MQVVAGGCPDAALLRAELSPVLALPLQVDGGDAAQGQQQAFVRDLGTRYEVEIEGKKRGLDDPARDCVERARVAAVFIALNASPAPPTPRAAAPVVAPTPKPEEPAPPAPREKLHLAVSLFGAGAYAPALDSGSPGAGFGVAVDFERLRFAFSAAALLATDITLSSSAGTRGAVQLTRLPLSWSAGYALRAGAIEFGPALGFELSVLRLRGMRVNQPQTELRLLPGALVALDGLLHLGSALSILLRLEISAFPRAYDLSVEPVGRVGHTPRLWLGGNLGIEWRLR